MQLAELHIEGLGRIVNRRLRLTPGFNLIYGPNEAGKSTLLEAIAALLYGLPEDAEDPAVRARLQALRPWQDGAFYAGSLTYNLDSGQGYRVQRRFLPRPHTTLQTQPEGVDVSGRFRAGEGPASFAQEHLGLDRAAFESLCLLRQGERGGLDPAVREAVLRLLEAAPPDPTTARAFERLEAALADQVGSPEDSSGPLARALAHCAALEEERERVLDARPGFLAQLAAQQRAKAELQRCELQHEQLRMLQAQATRVSERARSAATEETAAELARCEAEAERWQNWAHFPAAARDDLLRLSAQRSHLQMDCAVAEQRAHQAQETLRSLADQEAALRSRIDEAKGVSPEKGRESSDVQTLAGVLAAANEAETAANERWQTAHAALETLEQRLAQEGKPLAAVAPLGTEGLAAIQKRLHEARHRLSRARSALTDATARWTRLGLDESQFQALESGLSTDTPPPPSPVTEEHGGRQILSGVLKRFARTGQGTQTSEEAVYSEAQPLYANLLRCRIQVETAQQALRDTEATTLWQLGDLLGGTLEDNAFAALRERLEHYLRAAGELDEQRILVTALRADVEKVHERTINARKALQAELVRLGFDGGDLRESLAAYRRRAEQPGNAMEEAARERRRLRAETDLELLQLRKTAYEGEVDAWRTRQEALEDFEKRIAGLLAQSGITEYNSLDAAFVAYEEGFRNHERWERAQAALETAVRCHRALLGAQASADDDAARLLEIDAQLKTLGVEPPEWSTVASDRPPDEYAPLIEAMEAKLAAAREGCDRLRVALEQAAELRHPAEIDEEMEAACAEVQRLERFRQAVLLAREGLAATSREYRRHFTPQLGAVVQEGLSAILPERSAGVEVDPRTLAVSLRLPRTEEEVPAAMLGGSVAGLVDLLLRLAVARLVARTRGKVPLLLDEPLAYCDSERRQRAFDYLAQQAENTQILLFTADERLRARFQEKWAGSPVHQELALE